ncbi:MAG: radical SAM family heme chaperone HemW [Lachnospiraceae bacterium]|nr:radical SAM family heme chaperone HemW [Lachnospiraceae bacterium]
MPGEKLSLYIHIPFCIKKCNYCDFLSFPTGGRNTPLAESYAHALLREAEALRGGCQVDINLNRNSPYLVDINKPIKSIYFGGGTPNILNSEWIVRVLCKLNEIFTIDETAEISIELNPGVYEEKERHRELKALRAAGINRISTGLQSAHSAELKRLGRIHDLTAFLRLYEEALNCGFENINVDLMTGIPLQTCDTFARTLERVLELRPKHISAYSLIIEEGTPFGEADLKSLDLPEEEEEYEIYLMTRRILEQAGYRRYEISNYALPGYECAHNLVYWDRGDYLGLGLGAASLIGDLRFSNTKELNKYLAAPGRTRENIQRLSQQEAMEEFMFLGLRKTSGVRKADFKRMFGRDLEEVYGEVIEKQVGLSLMEEDRDGVRLTERGIDAANEVMAKFLL